MHTFSFHPVTSILQGVHKLTQKLHVAMFFVQFLVEKPYTNMLYHARGTQTLEIRSFNLPF